MVTRTTVELQLGERIAAIRAKKAEERTFLSLFGEEDAVVAREFEATVRGIVDERAVAPGDDLISTIVSARGEGVLESFAREPFPGVPKGDGTGGGTVARGEKRVLRGPIIQII